MRSAPLQTDQRSLFDRMVLMMKEKDAVKADFPVLITKCCLGEGRIVCL
jgi:hypothetical protein